MSETTTMVCARCGTVRTEQSMFHQAACLSEWVPASTPTPPAPGAPTPETPGTDQFQPNQETPVERLIRQAKQGASLYPGEGQRIVEHYERELARLRDAAEEVDDAIRVAMEALPTVNATTTSLGILRAARNTLRASLPPEPTP